MEGRRTLQARLGGLPESPPTSSSAKLLPPAQALVAAPALPLGVSLPPLLGLRLDEHGPFDAAGVDEQDGCRLKGTTSSSSPSPAASHLEAPPDRLSGVG